MKFSKSQRAAIKRAIEETIPGTVTAIYCNRKTHTIKICEVGRLVSTPYYIPKRELKGDEIIPWVFAHLSYVLLCRGKCDLAKSLIDKI